MIILKALGNNSDLRDKVRNTPSAADAVKIAISAGFTITQRQLIDAYKSRTFQMTEEQLNPVAGGKNDLNEKSACWKKSIQ